MVKINTERKKDKVMLIQSEKGLVFRSVSFCAAFCSKFVLVYIYWHSSTTAYSWTNGIITGALKVICSKATNKCSYYLNNKL